MSRPTYGHHLEAALHSKYAQAERLRVEIARAGAAWDFARHPYLRRWCSGELSPADLEVYAGEYHHAAVGLTVASRRAAALSDGLLADELTRHAEDQDDFIDLWCEFAAASGWCNSWYFGEDPLPETVLCARVWSGENQSLGHHLITMYAVQSVLAQVTPRQLPALVDRYGFEERSVRYFRLRAERAEGDAALLLAALTSVLPLPSPLALVPQAERAYRSYWELLDGVQQYSEASS
jgi:pyrroloquinoline quinone (PQQ) biosynthesis protein C